MNSQILLPNLELNGPGVSTHVYQIISTIGYFSGKCVEITYYVDPDNKSNWGSEIYYRTKVDRSAHFYYSRNYPQGGRLPKKYIKIVEKLRILHSLQFGE